MIHRGQMLFPEAIENLQTDLLFEQPHIVADRYGFEFVLLFQNVGQLTLQLVFIQLIVLVQPLLDG